MLIFLLPKDELTRSRTFLVLDLGLDIVDGVAALDLEGDGLARQCLHKDLHATPEAEHQVEGALLLDVVVSKRAPVLELLIGKDELPLVWGMPSLS